MPSLPTRPIPARTHESGGNYHGNHGGSTRAFLRVWNGIRAGSTPTRTPRVSREWGGESGPAAGPGKSSSISAGNRRVSWGGVRGWQHEERYRTRGGKLRTSLSRSGGHKRYRPAFPRLLYALRSSNPHAMQVFVTAEKIFSSGRICERLGVKAIRAGLTPVDSVDKPMPPRYSPSIITVLEADALRRFRGKAPKERRVRCRST